MKKLNKNLAVKKMTVEAFACGCSCSICLCYCSDSPLWQSIYNTHLVTAEDAKLKHNTYWS